MTMSTVTSSATPIKLSLTVLAIKLAVTFEKEAADVEERDCNPSNDIITLDSSKDWK
jgi:hypothetical protein